MAQWVIFHPLCSALTAAPGAVLRANSIWEGFQIPQTSLGTLKTKEPQ